MVSEVQRLLEHRHDPFDPMLLTQPPDFGHESRRVSGRGWNDEMVNREPGVTARGEIDRVCDKHLVAACPQFLNRRDHPRNSRRHHEDAHGASLTAAVARLGRKRRQASDTNGNPSAMLNTCERSIMTVGNAIGLMATQTRKGLTLGLGPSRLSGAATE